MRTVILCFVAVTLFTSFDLHAASPGRPPVANRWRIGSFLRNPIHAWRESAARRKQAVRAESERYARLLGRALKGRSGEKGQLITEVGENPPRPFFDRLTVPLYGVLMLPIVGQLVDRAVRAPESVGVIAAGAFLGYVLADFAVNITHKVLDDLAGWSTPFLGEHAMGFQRHHDAPAELGKRTFVDSSAGFTKLTVLPLALLAAHGLWNEGSSFLLSSMLSLLTFSTFSIEIHKWAHRPPKNWLIRTAQRWRLLESPTLHARHHLDPNSTRFGVVNGWSNWVTDATGLYTWVDRTWFAWTGNLPNNWKLGPEMVPLPVWAELALKPQLVPWEWTVTDDDQPADPIGVKLWLRHLGLMLKKRGAAMLPMARGLQTLMQQHANLGTAEARALIDAFVARHGAGQGEPTEAGRAPGEPVPGS